MSGGRRQRLNVIRNYLRWTSEIVLIRIRARHLGMCVVFASGTMSCADLPEDSLQGSIPWFEGAVDLEIGEVDGDDPYLFGAISGIAQDSLGRVFVSDRQADEVRVFGAEGSFLFSIGRRGEGPGELSAPCCIGFGPDGRIWVRESGNGRYSAFEVRESSAEFRETVRMNHGAANLQTNIPFDSAGRVIDVGSGPDASGMIATVRNYLNSNGMPARVDTISPPLPEQVGLHVVPREEGGTRMIFYFYQPFGPRHLIAHGPGGVWAEAISSQYEVQVHAGVGQILEISRPGSLGPELTPDERTEAAESIAEDRARGGLSPGDLPFDIPERKPPLRGLYFDQTGRLWVELNVAGETRAADVFDSEGSQVARYEWPERVAAGALAWIGREQLVGTTRDSLGVARVARVTFERRR